HYFNAVARKLRLRHVDFSFDDVLDTKGEVAHRDLVLYPVANAVDVLIVVARKMQHRFAHRFAGDRPGIDGSAANDLTPLDKRHTFAGLCALNCPAGPPGLSRSQRGHIAA